MSKRNLVLGLLICVAAVALAASVALAGPKHHGDKDKGKGHGKKTIVVVERATTDTPIDLGAPSDSIGDLLAFGNEVFDKTNTTKVGDDQGSCVRTKVGVAFECMWTTFLPGGQIVVEGPFFDAADSTLAITGGTGKFKNARGTMDLHAIDATTFMFTFHVKR
jgi:allene oxide cyclase